MYICETIAFSCLQYCISIERKKKKKKMLNLVALWKFSDLSTSQCVFHGLNEIKIGLGIRFDF